ncbi:MAG TPA: DUF5689 domain-containing protein [Cyclobacteriaceae bacterium]|nr:DUF5689 domain-containing protein [Cyclobacteriaceae bacterium]
MKFLPSAEHFYRIFVLVSFLAITVSCKDDENPEPVASTTAQFTQQTLAFLENEGEQTISLALDKPVLIDGQIVLKINTLAPQSFTTVPSGSQGQLVLPVFKGQVSVDFKIIPSDNSTLDGCKIVKFTIASMTEGLTPGSLRDLVVSVNDDEAPVAATFSFEELRVRESDPSGPAIKIDFAHPVPAEGILVIRMESTNSKYGNLYTTEPAAVGGKIFLHVDAGQTSAVVKVFPVNDTQYRPDRDIKLTIVDATGGVAVGEKNTLQCLITEDDGYQLSTISSIRAMYKDESMILHGDTYIIGVVSSIDNVAAGRIVVQDGSGALQLQLITAHQLTKGDVVLLNLNYGLLHDAFGVLEVSQVSVFEKMGNEQVPVNQMSLEELFSRGTGFQSQTIQITDLTFPEANGTLPMLGDRLATDGIRTIIVRTNASASFRDELLPDGTISVTGIFTICDGKYFLLPQDDNDIKRKMAMLKRF